MGARSARPPLIHALQMRGSLRRGKVSSDATVVLLGDARAFAESSTAIRRRTGDGRRARNRFNCTSACVTVAHVASPAHIIWEPRAEARLRYGTRAPRAARLGR